MALLWRLCVRVRVPNRCGDDVALRPFCRRGSDSSRKAGLYRHIYPQQQWQSAGSASRFVASPLSRRLREAALLFKSLFFSCLAYCNSRLQMCALVRPQASSAASGTPFVAGVCWPSSASPRFESSSPVTLRRRTSRSRAWM